MPSVATLQNPNPSTGTVARVPQTTGKDGANAPFVRLSPRSRAKGFSLSGLAFGTPIDKNLVPVGGYLAGLNVKVVASGGTGGGATYKADAPYSVIQTFTLYDPLGTPIITTTGYGLKLISQYSGQVAQGLQADPSHLPSWSAGDANGNFTFSLFIPLELDSAAYCALSSLNAAAQPKVEIQLALETAVYSANPVTTQPTIAITLDQAFWPVVNGNPALAPPDAGSSTKWTRTNGDQSIGGGGTNIMITDSKVGTWMHTLIVECRDNTGARTDAFPLTDLQLLVDSQALFNELLSEREDDMAKWTGGIARDTGVIAYTWRDSVGGVICNDDTHDRVLSTTAATLLQCGGTFQDPGNAPYTLTFHTGQLFPANPAKIPYTHLAA